MKGGCMRFNKKAIIVATCAACTLGLAAGCAPQQSETARTAPAAGDGAAKQEQNLLVGAASRILNRGQRLGVSLRPGPGSWRRARPM